MKTLERVVDELAYLKDVPGFMGFRIDEAGPDFQNRALAGKRYVVMVFHHPDDLNRFQQQGGKLSWTAAGMPAVVDFESQEGVRTMAVRLEERS